MKSLLSSEAARPFMEPPAPLWQLVCSCPRDLPRSSSSIGYDLNFLRSFSDVSSPCHVTANSVEPPLLGDRFGAGAFRRYAPRKLFLMKIVACGFLLYRSQRSYPFRSYKRAAAFISSVVSR